MKAIFRKLLCVVFVGVAVVGARGQDDSAAEAQLYFRTLGVIDSTNGGLYYSFQQKDVPVAVDENVRSPFYEYKGPATMVVYRLKTNPDKSVERIPVANIDLTGKGQWPLIIFEKKSGSATPKVTALADDLTVFPPSTYRFVNRSKYPCSCVLGAQSFALAPDEISLLPAPPSDATRHAVVVQVTGGVPKRLIYTSNWALQAGLRTMVFVDEGAGDFGVARRIVEGADVLATEMKKHKKP